MEKTPVRCSNRSTEWSVGDMHLGAGVGSRREMQTWASSEVMKDMEEKDPPGASSTWRDQTHTEVSSARQHVTRAGERQDQYMRKEFKRGP